MSKNELSENDLDRVSGGGEPGTPDMDCTVIGKDDKGQRVLVCTEKKKKPVKPEDKKAPPPPMW